MSLAIAKWLAGDDTGQSSKAIAKAALGGDPKESTTRYPSDGGDFGRCYRLLQAAPEAQVGLVALGARGGSYWKALVKQWAEIEKAYEADLKDKGQRTYTLMKSILRPIEDKDTNHIRLGSGMSIRFGGR